MISNADLIAQLPDPGDPWERIAAVDLQLGDHVYLLGNIAMVIGVQHIYTRGAYSLEVRLERPNGLERAEISFQADEQIFVRRWSPSTDPL